MCARASRRHNKHVDFKCTKVSSCSHHQASAAPAPAEENYLWLNNNYGNAVDSHPVVTTCVSTRVLVLPCASVMTVVVFVVFLLPSMLNSVFTSFLPPGGTSELSAGAAYLGLG